MVTTGVYTPWLIWLPGVKSRDGFKGQDKYKISLRRKILLI